MKTNKKIYQIGQLAYYDADEYGFIKCKIIGVHPLDDIIQVKILERTHKFYQYGCIMITQKDWVIPRYCVKRGMVTKNPYRYEI